MMCYKLNIKRKNIVNINKCNINNSKIKLIKQNFDQIFISGLFSANIDTAYVIHWN